MFGILWKICHLAAIILLLLVLAWCLGKSSTKGIQFTPDHLGEMWRWMKIEIVHHLPYLEVIHSCSVYAFLKFQVRNCSYLEHLNSDSHIRPPQTRVPIFLLSSCCRSLSISRGSWIIHREVFDVHANAGKMCCLKKATRYTYAQSCWTHKDATDMKHAYRGF